jgi:pimeloyl-ACP methyl ester carboxylesterase
MWNISAGAGSPVVFVHGALSDYRHWEPQVEAVGATWRAVAVSLSGYHPAPLDARNEWSAERHIVELGAFIGSFGVPVHLVGHSRGGGIALNVAARFNGAVRSLVLIEPGGEMAPDFLLPRPQPGTRSQAPTDVREQALALVKSGERERGMRRYIDSGHGEGRWDRLSPALQRIILSNAGTMSWMVRDRTGPLTADRARNISCPTLLIGGTDSPAVFSEVLDALQAYIPNHQRQSVANADHFLTWERAAVVNEALYKWLQVREA